MVCLSTLNGSVLPSCAHKSGAVKNQLTVCLDLCVEWPPVCTECLTLNQNQGARNGQTGRKGLKGGTNCCQFVTQFFSKKGKYPCSAYDNLYSHVSILLIISWLNGEAIGMELGRNELTRPMQHAAQHCKRLAAQDCINHNQHYQNNTPKYPNEQLAVNFSFKYSFNKTLSH